MGIKKPAKSERVCYYIKTLYPWVVAVTTSSTPLKRRALTDSSQSSNVDPFRPGRERRSVGGLTDVVFFTFFLLLFYF